MFGTEVPKRSEIWDWLSHTLPSRVINDTFVFPSGEE